MKQRLLAAISLSATFFLIGCADEQARSQIAATNAQVANLQETVGVIDGKTSTQKLVDILNKLDDLQNQINELNGNVDTLRQNQEENKKSTEQLYQNLEQQFQELQKENGGTPKITPKTTSNISNDDSSLKLSLQKIKARDFNGAIKDLKNIINTSNNAETIASASYYLSIAYAANAQYKDSIATARKFIKDNPNNKNIPDAMRTIYISQMQLGMKKSATNTANLLIKEYPNSEAAKKINKEIAN